MLKSTTHRRTMNWFIAVVATSAAGFGLSACSHATPALSQCAVVTNAGFGSGNQKAATVARPGDKVPTGNGNEVWYYPCDARNYVTATSGGDRSQPQAERTGPGAKNSPGMPVYVWTRVYFTPNENTTAMEKFMSFCLKYGCANNQPQTDDSISQNPHSSTPGWEDMLQENMGPAIDSATADVIGGYSSDLWQDHAVWGQLASGIAAHLDAELSKETGSGSIDYFCGDASTDSSCAQMTVVVYNVTPVDSAVQTEYNQGIAAQAAIASNAERLAAAQELYGPYAQYFLGLEDLTQQCGDKCTIYVGAPNAVPTASAGK